MDLVKLQEEIMMTPHEVFLHPKSLRCGDIPLPEALARQLIQDLVEGGFVRKVGVGGGTRFFAGDNKRAIIAAVSRMIETWGAPRNYRAVAHYVSTLGLPVKGRSGRGGHRSVNINRLGLATGSMLLGLLISSGILIQGRKGRGAYYDLAGNKPLEEFYREWGVAHNARSGRIMTGESAESVCNHLIQCGFGNGKKVTAPAPRPPKPPLNPEDARAISLKSALGPSRDRERINALVSAGVLEAKGDGSTVRYLVQEGKTPEELYSAVKEFRGVRSGKFVTTEKMIPYLKTRGFGTGFLASRKPVAPPAPMTLTAEQEALAFFGIYAKRMTGIIDVLQGAGQQAIALYLAANHRETARELKMYGVPPEVPPDYVFKSCALLVSQLAGNLKNVLLSLRGAAPSTDQTHIWLLYLETEANNIINEYQPLPRR